MCTTVVIDADVFGSFLRESAHSVLHSWIIKGNGVVAYTQHGRYARELKGSPRMLELFGEYRRAQRAKLIEAEVIHEMEDTIDESSIQSNDKHVIALAKAGDALILCSNDRVLHQDFLDVELLPNVNGQRRAVYPMKTEEKVRRQFLDNRVCPRLRKARSKM